MARAYQLRYLAWAFVRWCDHRPRFDHQGPVVEDVRTGHDRSCLARDPRRNHRVFPAGGRCRSDLVAAADVAGDSVHQETSGCSGGGCSRVAGHAVARARAGSRDARRDACGVDGSRLANPARPAACDGGRDRPRRCGRPVSIVKTPGSFERLHRRRTAGGQGIARRLDLLLPGRGCRWPVDRQGDL